MNTSKVGAGGDSVAMRLAHALVDAAGRPVEDTVLHAAERVVLDTVACALGAVDASPVKAVRAWSRMI
jgi:2-methylcitrate dehydratase PrpD